MTTTPHPTATNLNPMDFPENTRIKTSAAAVGNAASTFSRQ
ncbi:hypothetical protein [Mycobacterium ostraviense]|nr:hypothetical protein [Mycobacterium ostraviense]